MELGIVIDPMDDLPKHEPPVHDTDRGSLPAVFGMCLALGAFLMAPVPFLGPVLGIGGFIMSWQGLGSDFRGTARVGLWINGGASLIGIAITAWFIWRYA